MLSRAEEARYLRAYRDGDNEAGKILALLVAPLVVSLASRWSPPAGMTKDDLVQEAHLAVLTVIRKGFNPKRGRLTTLVQNHVTWALLKVIARSKQFKRQFNHLECPEAIFDHRRSIADSAEQQQAEDVSLDIVLRYFRCLPARDRQVLAARMHGRKLREIACDERIFSPPVSREHVRQIAKNAIQVIRLAMLGNEKKSSVVFA